MSSLAGSLTRYGSRGVSSYMSSRSCAATWQSTQGTIHLVAGSFSVAGAHTAALVCMFAAARVTLACRDRCQRAEVDLDEVGAVHLFAMDSPHSAERCRSGTPP